MKTVLITGASRGLGLALTRCFAQDNWRVFATCRNPETAHELLECQKNYPTISSHKLDVIDPVSLLGCMESLERESIDILINCAGILTAQGGSTDDNDQDSDQTFGTAQAQALRKIMETNFIAPVMVSQALLPLIKKGHQKKIIMISSRCGSLSTNKFPHVMGYNTSKAALNMAMRNMAVLLAPFGITVVSLHPGWVRTDMGGAEAPLSSIESATALKTIIDGLTIDNSGQFIDNDGALIAW